MDERSGEIKNRVELGPRERSGEKDIEAMSFDDLRDPVCVDAARKWSGEDRSQVSIIGLLISDERVDRFPLTFSIVDAARSNANIIDLFDVLERPKDPLVDRLSEIEKGSAGLWLDAIEAAEVVEYDVPKFPSRSAGVRRIQEEPMTDFSELLKAIMPRLETSPDKDHIVRLEERGELKDIAKNETSDLSIDLKVSLVRVSVDNDESLVDDLVLDHRLDQETISLLPETLRVIFAFSVLDV
jgi:hypothetical protein